MSPDTPTDREPCDRCGRSTANRAPGDDSIPLCRPCVEELEFWADVFEEAAG